MSHIKELSQKLKEKESRIKKAYIDGIDSIEEYKNNKQDLIAQKSFLESNLQKALNIASLVFLWRLSIIHSIKWYTQGNRLIFRI